jgi:hypothetical protein
MSSDWIREMKQAEERAEAQQNARLEKVGEDSMAIASGEDEFFSQLVAACESDAARMPEIGLFGHVTKQGSPGRYTSVHIGVEFRGLNPNPTNATIHHDPNSGKLRCLALESGFQELHFDLVRHPKGGIGVAYRSRVLTAREFADITMKAMVKKVKPSHGTAA